MNAISLGEVWEEARLVFVREIQLLMPVAAAFLGLPMILVAYLAPTVDQLRAGQGVAGFVLAGLVALFASVVGMLAISALVLRPGASVREALGRAGARFGTALLALVLVALFGCVVSFVGMIVLAVVASATGMTGTMAAGQTAPHALVALFVVLILVPLIAVTVRLVTIWPLIADRPDGPLAALKASFRQTRPVFWRVLLVAAAFTIVVQLIGVAITWGLGSFAVLIGNAAGVADLATALVVVLHAAFAAIANAFWVVFLARLYLRLSAASSGI